MAEYYPLLAKAIGSLPNSTLESRRVVYERARKALIGQLRTLHPPVPDDDIERESVALDRAVERVESELASGVLPGTPSAAPDGAIAKAPPPAARTSGPATETGAPAPAGQRPAPPLRPPAQKPPAAKPPQPKPPQPKPPEAKPLEAKPPAAKPPGIRPPASAISPDPSPSADDTASGPPALKPPAARPPLKAPAAKRPAPPIPAGAPIVDGETSAPLAGEATPPASSEAASSPIASASEAASAVPPDESKRLKPPQRPVAPQPQGSEGPKRRLWIIPVAVGVVAAVVALAAWELRDRPETLVKNKPAEQTETETGKTAQRVGEPSTPSPTAPETPSDQPSRASGQTGNAPQPAQPAGAANPNPEVPVAHRAALLVEAPDEPNKVKTFLGNVVWKLDNAPQGAADAVGLAVEADIELPDDKMKAVVTFEKNTDASLPASHTIKVRFMPEPGSFSGNVKQISVPQMRPEASPSGEPLAGVTVPITTNSFLVGLSPGNAEAANMDLIRRLQWIDVPMMLENGKIAKLTFEKSDSGQRDLNEAMEAWQK